MKKTALLLLAAFGISMAQAADMSDEQKTFYALGVVLGQQMNGSFDPSPAELEFIKKGLADGASGVKPAVDMDAYQARLHPLSQARVAARSKKLLAAGKAFADKAGKEAGAVKTASGLVYRALKEGSGANPTADDNVKVHYRGTFIDGKEFDSSYARKQPAEFPLKGVIKCWTEGVAKMRVGGKARLVCPADLAYGKQGKGSILPDTTLVFEVELLDILKSAKK